MKRIVILGGGFGGIYTAIHLEKYLKQLIKKNEVELVLVNRNNYFVYPPMLSEVVGGSVGLFDTVSPLRRLLRKTKLYVREIEKIDLNRKIIFLTPEFSHTPTELIFDQLILALGNVTDFRGNPGLHEHALPFKNLADALIIRNQIIDAIETAANEPDPQVRKQLLTFVVGGGGFSGTEICAEINDFVRNLCHHYPEISNKEISVVLIHAGERLLNREMHESLGIYAGKLLARRGVEIRFNRLIETATPEEVILDDQNRIAAKTIICTAPSNPNPLIEQLNLPKNKGRILTNRYLQVEKSDSVWALGDCALIPLEDGTYAPPTAQFAVREAKQLAKNLAAHLKGEKKKPFSFKVLGMLCALGHHSAVALLFDRFKFSGFPAWILWRMIYWSKLPGFDRKLKTLFSWFLDLLIPADAVQLKITPTQGIAQLHFESGDIIFREGDAGDYLYIITEGQVEIFNKGGHLANLNQGEYFGEMALLNEKRRSATAKCLKPTNVLALSKKDFGFLIANFTELRKNFEETERKRRSRL